MPEIGWWSAMSDLCDRADGCAAVAASGAVFSRRRPPAAGAALPAIRHCACGGKPAFFPHKPFRRGGPSLETLACPVCGRSAGPERSRHVLVELWADGER